MPRYKNRARRWVHLSQEHKKDVILSHLHFRGYNDEADTPRLCVTKTVAGALAARVFLSGEPVNVYLTEPCRTVRPVAVWDSVITGERWVVRRVTLHKVDEVPPEVVEGVRALQRSHVLQKGNVTIHERVLHLALAVEMLDQCSKCLSLRHEVPWFSRDDQRFVRLANAYFEQKRSEDVW